MMEQTTLPIVSAKDEGRGPLVGPRLFFVVWVILLDLMAFGWFMDTSGEAAVPALPIGSVYAAAFHDPAQLDAALRTAHPPSLAFLASVPFLAIAQDARVILVELTDGQDTDHLLLWDGAEPDLEGALRNAFPGTEQSTLPDGSRLARYRPSKSDVVIVDEPLPGLQKAETPAGPLWFRSDGTWHVLSTSHAPFRAPWRAHPKETKESAYFRTFRAIADRKHVAFILPNPLWSLQKIWL